MHNDPFPKKAVTSTTTTRDIIVPWYSARIDVSYNPLCNHKGCARVRMSTAHRPLTSPSLFQSIWYRFAVVPQDEVKMNAFLFDLECNNWHTFR